MVSSYGKKKKKKEEEENKKLQNSGQGMCQVKVIQQVHTQPGPESRPGCWHPSSARLHGVRTSL